MEVEKHFIIEYAHNNSIPYLKNTTPTWSNRGKMREIFIPATKKQFGESVDQKIIYLSNSLLGYKQILDKLVFNPLLKNINIYDNGLSINITDYLDMPLHFWQIVLKELFHKLR